MRDLERERERERERETHFTFHAQPFGRDKTAQNPVHLFKSKRLMHRLWHTPFYHFMAEKKRGGGGGGGGEGNQGGDAKS